MSCICFFFLFKQKTAYEMRISDWSSDVCSSDLWSGLAIPAVPVAPAADTAEGFAASADDGGPRRQPELSEAVAYAPELAAPAADLALLDDDDDLPLPLPRQLDPAMQRTARLASLDPNAGIEL